MNERLCSQKCPPPVPRETMPGSERHVAGRAGDLGHSRADEHTPPWKRKKKTLRLGWVENGKKQLLKQLLQKHREQCASLARPSDDRLGGGGGDSVLPGEGTKPPVPSTEVENIRPQLGFIHKNLLKAQKCDSHQVRH